MADNPCLDVAAKAVGRDLSAAERADLDKATLNRAKRLQRQGMTPGDAVAEAGRQLAAETRLAAAIEKRAQADNIIKAKRLDARAVEGKENQSVMATLGGVEGNARDLGRSVDAEGHASVAQVFGPLENDLDKAGVKKALLSRNKELDRDIARDLFASEDPTLKGSGNPVAKQIADVLHKYQEVVRGMQNNAGAWIGRLDHYVTRQSHDAFKIAADSFENWRDFITPRLAEETFDHLDSSEDVQRFLHATWNALRTGVHDSSNGSEVLSGFKGPGNLAKRISQNRTLHFKDADTWLEYNQKYGRGNVADSVFQGLEHGARNASLMRTFGANPQAMYEGWIKRLVKRATDRGDYAEVKRLQGQFKNSIFDVVTRKASQPGNQSVAAVGSWVRNAQAISKLGGTMISSFSDIPIQAAMLRHNGISIFDAVTQQVKGLIPGESKDAKHVASLLGAGHDALIGEVMHRFQAEDSRIGQMSRLAARFHSLTGLNYWTDSLKSAGAMMLSHNLALVSGKAFGKINGRLQTTLRRYGIEEGEWKAIQQAKQKAADGRNYILPSEMHNLPDDAVAHLVDGDDAAAHDRARQDLATKLQTYVSDQVREGMTEPTAAGRAMATLGTKPGTAAGELVRFIQQFRQYTITYLTRTLGREFLRGGEGNVSGGIGGFLQGAKQGADYPGLAMLIAGTTALGYVSMQTKSILAGKTPRTPTDTAGIAAMIAASMEQGGGAGIFGDFLFSQSSRFGQSALDTFLGPTFGTLSDANDLFQAIIGRGTDKATGQKEKGHLGLQAMNFIKNDVPLGLAYPPASLLNTFYGKAAMQYLVYGRLQELLGGPGYMQRYMAGIKKQTGQSFWLSPGANPYKAVGLGQ